MEKEVVVTKEPSPTTWLLIGAFVTSLTISGCGVRGPLEPPPKKEDRDEVSLDIERMLLRI